MSALLSHIVDVDWAPRRALVRNESPFTGRQQRSTLRFNRWEFVVTYAKTRGANAAAKIAALSALKGGSASFNFNDPSKTTPQSGYSGSAGTVDTSASGYTIPVKGLDAGALVAVAGDFMSVQVGGTDWQLFVVASDATTDTNGDVSITVNNPVRGTASDDDAVRFNNWLVTVTLEDDEKWRFDKHGNLIIPPLRFIEDF